MRVVSLVPAATEILCALDHEPVGTSHECDYPSMVASLPSLTTSRVDSDAETAVINVQVTTAIETAGSVYDLDSERLVELDPDLVIVQGVCDVCAIDQSVVRETIDRLRIHPEILSVHSHTVSGIFDDIQRIGAVIGKQKQAEALGSALQRRINQVADRAPTTPNPSVVVLDWLDPVMVAGHWIPELVEAAGGSYDLADPGTVSEPREWEAIQSCDPDVIIIAPCGFSINQTVAGLETLTDRRGWTDLSAVQNDRVVVMDGNQYVNRPGPRIVDTAVAFAGILHPDVFSSPALDLARPLHDQRPA